MPPARQEHILQQLTAIKEVRSLLTIAQLDCLFPLILELSSSTTRSSQFHERYSSLILFILSRLAMINLNKIFFCICCALIYICVSVPCHASFFSQYISVHIHDECHSFNRCHWNTIDCSTHDFPIRQSLIGTFLGFFSSNIIIDLKKNKIFDFSIYEVIKSSPTIC